MILFVQINMGKLGASLCKRIKYDRKYDILSKKMNSQNEAFFEYAFMHLHRMAPAFLRLFSNKKNYQKIKMFCIFSAFLKIQKMVFF